MRARQDTLDFVTASDLREDTKGQGCPQVTEKVHRKNAEITKRKFRRLSTFASWQ
jgi:hypothetical protein